MSSRTLATLSGESGGGDQSGTTVPLSGEWTAFSAISTVEILNPEPIPSAIPCTTSKNACQPETTSQATCVLVSIT